MKNWIIFSTDSYEYLAAKIAKEGKFAAGTFETKRFPDGERYLRFTTDVKGRNAVLVGGTINETDTLELFDMACGLVTQGCESLTLIIPFFGYSTMERAVKQGEVVTAKTRAVLFSAIPRAPSGNRVALLDLHSEGIPYYFERGVIPTHLYARPVILKVAKELGGKDFVLACVDAGRAKWVESLANDLGVDASFVFKRRLGDKKVAVTGISADVGGRKVVIYDDMIRTGSSVINAAKAYKESGAKEISIIATHGVFPGDACAKLKKSGLIARVVVTDSHPAALKNEDKKFLSVESTASIFSEFIKGLSYETH